MEKDPREVLVEQLDEQLKVACATVGLGVTIMAISDALKGCGCSENEVRLALLSLFGVPLKPVTPLGLTVSNILIGKKAHTYSEKDLKEAFLAGFMESGEGWNGEYPHKEDANIAWKNGVADGYEKWRDTGLNSYERLTATNAQKEQEIKDARQQMD